jgi:hypothetical protein
MNTKIKNLLESQEYWFRDWPNSAVPKIACGVYCIWDSKEKFIYVGMSGREISKMKDIKRPYGLYTRLSSHASGRLSGDQFCVYVANRIIVPIISKEDKLNFESGKLTLDILTKKYIRENLKYKFIVLKSETEVYELERFIQKDGIKNKKPFLNPL